LKLNYEDTCGVSRKEIENEGGKLLSIISEMKKSAKRNDYSDCFASINLPFDALMRENIKNLAKEYENKINYIIVIGVGGSNLGTVAVYEALLGKLYNIAHRKTKKPKILFADTIDPDYVLYLKNIVESSLEKGENVLINYVSKSGSTIETTVNFEIFLGLLKKYREDYRDYVVVTTDKNSGLWHEGKQNNFKILEVPKNVGGRFSVLSAVGLFSLSLVGIEIDKLLEGAGIMRDKCLNENIFENPAALSAIVTYLYYKGGRNINVNFLFSSELESVGKWLKQLTGESLGKEKNIRGEKVNVGITPKIATTVDLHSMVQLYLAGPPDKFTNFVRIKNNENNVVIPSGNYAGKTLSEITNAIISGVQESYKKRKIPFFDIVLDDISEVRIGEFLQFRMIETIFIAQLLEINPFDQPNIEEYKSEARRILAGK